MSTQTTRPTELHATTKRGPSAGSKPPAPTNEAAATKEVAWGRDQTSLQANDASAPILEAPAGSQIGRDHSRRDTHPEVVSATNIPSNQSAVGAQSRSVAGERNQPTATAPPAAIDGTPSAADNFRTATVEPLPRLGSPSGGAEQGPPVTIVAATPTAVSSLADPFLALAADVLDDLEKVRIANENRLRQLTRDEVDADGEERGFGLTEDHPDVARLAVLVDGLAKAEHQATLNLQRVMRKHPLGPWVKATAGVGEKQAARLLASIGDPYWNTLHDRPRTVSELWAYCGYHVLPARQNLHGLQDMIAGGSKTGHPGHTRPDAQGAHVGVAPKRQRGAQSNWSSAAKMRTYLIAESCIKQRTSPFRPVYDDTRAKYAEAVHDVPCVRCGPSGKPAPNGSPLSDGHKHARAMRAVSKEILKELWRASRDIHLNTPPADHREGSTPC